MGEEKDRRVLTDRRRKPTPRWSWYTFFGRRTTFRRKSDQEKGGYVDRYSHLMFFILVLILGLNILDSLFTMMIIDLGGQEFNPPQVHQFLTTCWRKLVDAGFTSLLEKTSRHIKSAVLVNFS